MAKRGFWWGLIRDWGTAFAVVIALYVMWMMLFGPSAPEAGGEAPDFALSDLEGNEIALADIGEGPAVLNFWFTTCGPCRHEIPELVKFHDAHPDVPLYGVSVDRMDTKRLAAVSRKLTIDYPVLHDASSQVATAYDVSVYPTTIILKDGLVAEARIGEVTQSSLEAMVDRHR